MWPRTPRPEYSCTFGKWFLNAMFFHCWLLSRRSAGGVLQVHMMAGTKLLCVCACVCVCARVGVCACVRACVCVCAPLPPPCSLTAQGQHVSSALQEEYPFYFGTGSLSVFIPAHTVVGKVFAQEDPEALEARFSVDIELPVRDFPLGPNGGCFPRSPFPGPRALSLVPCLSPSSCSRYRFFFVPLCALDAGRAHSWDPHPSFPGVPDTFRAAHRSVRTAPCGSPLRSLDVCGSCTMRTMPSPSAWTPRLVCDLSPVPPLCARAPWRVTGEPKSCQHGPPLCTHVERC